MAVTADLVRTIGLRLRQHYGPLHWWPAASSFEVVVGAVLTQNTAWSNVERAIANLRAADLLTAPPLRTVDADLLAELVRPSGTYRVKARRLRALLDWLGDDWLAPLTGETETVRRNLLAVKGVGEETADAILLYAAGHPTFVIDAYTRRIMGRIGVRPTGEGYAEWRAWFMAQLPAEVALFNEYHAGLVQLAKDHCRTQPRCGGCPLRDLCAWGTKDRALPTQRVIDQ